MNKLFSISIFVCCLNFCFSQISVTTTNTTSPLCFSLCNGSITVSASNGVAPYSYQWTNALGNTIGTNSPTISGLCAGTYTCIVSDASSAGVQTIYTENFNSGAPTWTLNTPVGPQGTDPNFFTISDNEGGVAVGSCGVANNGDNSLHITSVFNPAGGAAYDAGGLCGILFCPETHARANSSNINTTGFSNLTLAFDFIANGSPNVDKASVWYNSGSGWTILTNNLVATVCGSGQGLWTAYSQVLPASCNNITNLQVGIQWDNNDDGVGSDPSVAINNVRITTPSAAGNLPVNEIVVLTEPTAVVISNTAFVNAGCGVSDGSITITASGGTGALSYSINNGTNFSGANVFSSLAAGNYPIIVQDANGCQVSGTANITSTNGPIFAQINTTNPTCNQANGEIEIVGFAGTAPYSYSVDNGLNFQIGNTFTGLVNGSYSLILADANGCQTLATANLLNSNGPNVDAGANQTICVGQTATLTGSSSTAGVIFSWDNGVTNALPFSPLVTTTYTLTGTDPSGCTATDQVTITLESPPVISVSPSITSGCAPLTVDFTNTTTGSNNCNWAFSSGQTFNSCGNQTLTFSNSDCISLVFTATSTGGCVVNQSFTDIVCVQATPVASFSYSPSVLSSSNALAQMDNTSTGANTYLWNFGNGASSNVENPSHTFSIDNGQNQVITLIASNAFGCSDTASNSVRFNDDMLFYIPNAFTPNGDGWNNLFYGVFTEGFDVSLFYLAIYDRWGELLFDTKDHTATWDGMYKGEEVKDGLYTWVVELKSPTTDFKQKFTGHIGVYR